MKILKAKCDECPLADAPFCPPKGPANPALVVVGEAPGQQEVLKGEPFIGPAGELLQAILRDLGVPWSEVWRTNAILCRPPKNRDPSASELACCGARLAAELEGVQVPIIALGRAAQRVLQVSGTNHWRGNRIGAYHPAYYLRNPDETADLVRSLHKAVNIPRQEPIEPEITLLDSVEKCLTTLAALQSGYGDQLMIWDIEAEQNKWYRDPMLCMQIAVTPVRAYVIPDSVLHTPQVREAVEKFLLGWQGPNGGHNIKFDMGFLAGGLDGHRVDWSYDQMPMIDTMLMHYVLKETTGGHGLKALCEYYFDAEDYEEELIGPYLKSKADNYGKIPRPILYEYGGLDVCYNWKLAKVLEEEVRAQGMWDYYEIKMKSSWAAHKMEMRGMRVDRPWITKVKQRLSMECAEHAEEMDDLAFEEYQEWIDEGEEIPVWFDGSDKNRTVEKFERIIGRIDDGMNPGSFEQLRVVMFDFMNFPQGLIRKDGERTTNANVLRMLEERYPDDEFLQELIYWRKKNKMLTSYVNNLLPLLDESDRVHASFLIHGTETGRLAIRDPALQTIPRPGDEDDPFSSLGNLIRGAFIAAPGHKLIVADYAQAELRVAAHFSQEPYLVNAFIEGVDVHSSITEGMFGPGFTKENRSETKRLVFCKLYGGKARNFSQDYAVPYSKAKPMFDKMGEMMPTLHEYIEDMLATLKRQGYVETVLGHRRRLPLITNQNLHDARKLALNSPIQGSAHDLITLTSIELTKRGYKTVLEVHDSVLFEELGTKSEASKVWTKGYMEGIGEKYFPSIPWKADVEIRDRWGRDE